MSTSRKDHLVETAAALFEENGYHATGIDTILATSGVAKMTLYNHFKSKEELIVAALALRDGQFMARLDKQVQATSNTPEERLLAIFDVLETWFRSDTFRGCLFVAATHEYADRAHPIHQQAAAHKRHIFDYLLNLAQDGDRFDARAIAQQLLVLYEGAISVAHALDAPIAARQARRAAKTILASH
jgi:AcrR family transcriptional regulator